MTRAEKIEKLCSECTKIASDDSHGYSNVVGDNTGAHGDYDCGGFVSEGLKRAGLIPQGAVYEPNERYGNPWSYGTVLEPAGFVRLPFRYDDVQRGDILIKDGHHTELALGNGKQVGAHDNYDGVRGDYSHLGEISEVPLSGYWDYIYRLKDDPRSYPQTPFAVRVLIDDLYIRKGAGTSYGTSGYVRKGRHIIDDVKNDFGQLSLSDGAGWIYIGNDNYTTIGGHVEVSPYKDVKTDDPAYTWIKKCYDAGVMSGYADGKFRPKRKVTRQQLAITLGKLLDRLNK